MNQISTVAQGAHPLSVLALIACYSNHNFRHCQFDAATVVAAIAAILSREPLLCFYTDRTAKAANQVKVVSALKGKHKRIEYRACLTRNQTLETLETKVTLVLQTTGKARLDYGPQQLTEFIYGLVRRGLLITEVVKWTTTSCDCSLNEDIDIAITNIWPTTPLF